MAPWLPGSWLHGSLAPWLHGSWLHGSLAPGFPSDICLFQDRAIQVRHHILTMWLKDKSQKLEGSILRDKLKLDVTFLECAVDDRGLLIAHIRTQSKRRGNEILKFIMGEEALSLTKQPAAINIPVLDYNLCVPSDGHKIAGADGIQIFSNSMDAKVEFETFCAMIDRSRDGKGVGQYLGKWEYNPSAVRQERLRMDEQQWIRDDEVQQQAMDEDPGAFGLGSDTGEQEAEQTEQVMVAVSK